MKQKSRVIKLFAKKILMNYFEDDIKASMIGELGLLNDELLNLSVGINQ